MIFENREDFLRNCKINTRLMSIDFGTKNIGIAVSDKTRYIATPKIILHRKNNIADIQNLIKIIEDNTIGGIIIGLPMTSYEEETSFCKRIKQFAHLLLDKKDIPIFFVNEYLSSFQAEDFLMSDMRTKLKKTKDIVDKVAAAYILQEFLNKN